MRDVLLLRWCQVSIVLCGLLFIAIGSGVTLPWLPPLALLSLSGALAGALYEKSQRGRGESEGMLPLLLPAIGGVSGTFALLAHI